MSIFHSGAGDIWYEDSGGEGLPVVFSHGFLMDGEMFEANVAALRTKYRCVVWDQRGFGRTGPVSEPFTYWDSACDLLALLDHLDIAKAVLAGMSQGGFVSLRAALLAPERVAALVLIDTRAGVDAPEVIAGFEALDAQWKAYGCLNVKTDLAALLGIAHAPEPWFRKWERIGNADLHHPIAALKDRDDITARVAEIGVPALIVHGAEDVAIDIEHGRALQRALRKSVPLVVISGAGHAPNLQFPELVNPAIAEFLDGVLQTS